VFLLWIGLGAVVVGLSVLIAPDLSMAWQLLVFAGAMLGSIGFGFVVQRSSRINHNRDHAQP
jgi:inner membrane protein